MKTKFCSRVHDAVKTGMIGTILQWRKGHFWCFGAFLLCHGWCYRSCKNVHKFDKLLVLVFSMGNRLLQKHNLMALLLLLPCYRAQSIDACKIWVIKGPVTAVQLILFNFANYLPSIAMELEVSEETTHKWQNHNLVTNKYVLPVLRHHCSYQEAIT